MCPPHNSPRRYLGRFRTMSIPAIVTAAENQLSSTLFVDCRFDDHSSKIRSCLPLGIHSIAQMLTEPATKRRRVPCATLWEGWIDDPSTVRMDSSWRGGKVSRVPSRTTIIIFLRGMKNRQSLHQRIARITLHLLYTVHLGYDVACANFRLGRFPHPSHDCKMTHT